MQPVGERQIRQSLVNCSRSEAAAMTREVLRTV
jgi:hypothetical protein